MTSMHKILGTIEREVRALASDMNDMASRFQATYPDCGMMIRRSPDRVILQAGDVGVSVSWFRSRAGENAGVELVIAEWDGEITFPGATAREGRHATQIGEQRFHLIPSVGETWEWEADDLKVPCTPCSSRTLAVHCMQVLAKRLVDTDFTGPLDISAPSAALALAPPPSVS